ncbi:pallilysin-related adhesin [Treponema sp.]|uniref:pallilysin-related adhesin n=1 Tax=Treponema sp. TaxID=166 RepID=UPI003EFDD6EA
MQRKVTVSLFIVIVAAGVVALIAKNYIYKPDKNKASASVVVPMLASAEEKKDASFSSEEEDSALVSLVPLNDDETLISIVSMDFDGDGFDDQVNVIKTMDSPYLAILVGLYNPQKNSYERKAVIATEISQAQTFSYTGMDLTGEHRIALVYQGFADNGDSILQAFFISNEGGKFSLSMIADLRGDGTVFIQQIDRYDAYERSKANGARFPIWVYSSDTENPGSADQLQIQYEWSHSEGKYVKTRTIRVAGSRIAEKELAKIQDGTVATFAAFLNGVWFMPEADGSVRCVFFDYDAREIIFFKDDTEEVYKWAHSNIRRNGIYLSTINQEIENLQRRIDISLKSTEEIQIRIQDDVRMLINENAFWDGNYKKTGKNIFLKQGSEPAGVSSAVLAKDGIWKIPDGSTVKLENGKYLIENESFTESGFFSCFEAAGDSYIQFRSPTAENARFSGIYRISIEDLPSDKKKCILQPCRATGYGIIPLESRPVVLMVQSD